MWNFIELKEILCLRHHLNNPTIIFLCATPIFIPIFPLFEIIQALTSFLLRLSMSS